MPQRRTLLGRIPVSEGGETPGTRKYTSKKQQSIAGALSGAETNKKDRGAFLLSRQREHE